MSVPLIQRDSVWIASLRLEARESAPASTLPRVQGCGSKGWGPVGALVKPHPLGLPVARPASMCVHIRVSFRHARARACVRT